MTGQEPLYGNSMVVASRISKLEPNQIAYKLYIIYMMSYNKFQSNSHINLEREHND